MIIVDQIIASRYERGSDWGVKRPVLAMTEDRSRMLFIWPGHMTWGGVGQRQRYHAIELVLLTSVGEWRTLIEGGRITHKAIQKAKLDTLLLSAVIDTYFEVPGLTEKLDMKRTCIVPNVGGSAVHVR